MGKETIHTAKHKERQLPNFIHPPVVCNSLLNSPAKIEVLVPLAFPCRIFFFYLPTAGIRERG